MDTNTNELELDPCMICLLKFYLCSRVNTDELYRIQERPFKSWYRWWYFVCFPVDHLFTFFLKCIDNAKDIKEEIIQYLEDTKWLYDDIKLWFLINRNRCCVFCEYTIYTQMGNLICKYIFQNTDYYTNNWV